MGSYEYSSDMHKYPDVQVNQAGLELGHPSQRRGQDVMATQMVDVEWPESNKPVWGIDEMTAEEEKLRGVTKPRSICGLSSGVFWGIIVLLRVLIAGGIGGEVGAGLAKGKDTCSSVSSVDIQNCPNPNTSSDSPTTIAPTATETLSLTQSGSATTSSATSSVSPAPSSLCGSASSLNEASLQPLDATGNPYQLGQVNQTFEVLCNMNFPGGGAYGNPGLHDIMKMYQPDLMHCVAACAAYNVEYQGNADAGISVGGGLCKAVSLVIAAGKICFLKNGTGVNDTSTSGGNRIVSAVLE